MNKCTYESNKELMTKVEDLQEVNAKLNEIIDEVTDYLYYYKNRLVNSNIYIQKDEIEQLIALLEGEEDEESNNN